jgi:hypothetical protein
MREEFDPQYVDDLLNLEKHCKSEAEYKQLLDIIDLEYPKIRKHPIDYTAPCVYEPLASAKYRKNKFHSKPNATGNADMRIVFQYIPEEDYIYYISVGFRRKDNPSVYDRAKTRFLLYQLLQGRNAKNDESAKDSVSGE